MWKPWQWAGASNERAIANARAAATECGRIRLERTEVEQFLAERQPQPTPSTQPA